MDNYLIRQRMKEKRESLSAAEHQKLSFIISNTILHSLDYKTANTIGIYASKANEVDTYKIISKALEDGKTVCLPKVVGKDLLFYQIMSMGDLSEGHFHVLEPTTKTIIKDINCMYIPLLAFNKQNYRIGYGKGYYDRYLMNVRTRKIGLAFSFQFHSAIEVHSLDIPMDEIITELSVHKLKLTNR